VYVARFGATGHSNQDIGLVEEIPVDFDLLVGGFPCQDYSVAKSLSSASGLQGKKGVLWWDILRLVRLHKPRLIFLENVDRLLKSPADQRGRDFAVMLSTLGLEGYSVEWRVVNSADYGFPQRRIRVFIVATLSQALASNPREIILKTGVLAKALPVRSILGESLQVDISSDPTKVTAKFGVGLRQSPFLNSGFYSDGTAHTARTEALFRGARHTLRDVLEPDSSVPEDYWVDTRRLPDWEALKGAKKIPRIHKETGFHYLYSEGRMAFPDSIDKPSRTILTGEGGATPSRFKHLIRSGDGFRRLLPIELERLCGFPDNWTNPPSLEKKLTSGRRAFFMGNALVVGLVQRVGKALAQEMNVES
jgi:DNA (cytosine-5)-methyltransferase 1